MSVNPDDMNMASGVAEEYVDLEHQVIRQKLTIPPNDSLGLSPGEPGAEFEPGERQLDREEIAQLVFYRRYAFVGFETAGGNNNGAGAIFDASVGINGDLFRETTTQTNPEPGIEVDEGGEIGLLDNYTLGGFSNTFGSGSADLTSNGQFDFCEFSIDYYNWPTGGPIVDSFDTITCGFGSTNFNDSEDANVELRYDFYWDVAEQGRTTNPFGRPSTR